MRPGSKPWRPLFVAVALIALFAGAWWVSGRRTSSVASQPENLTILIGDFENRTGESVFNGAIEQALAISLEGAPFINAFDRARARDQVVELAPESDGRLDEASTRLICRSHGIELALMGSVERDPSRSGSAYRVHVRAIDPVTAEVLSEVSEPVPDKASVLRVVDRLATELRGAFGDLNPTSRQAFQDETFTTSSLDAMQLYATAQELTDAGRFEEAFSAYKEAISHDAEFGRAYTGIGIALMNLDRSTEAGPYFDRALSLTHRMTERERFLARGTYYMFSRNYPKAIDEYSELIREFPSEETPNLPLAHFFCYDFEEAFAASQRMQEREPTLLRRLNTAIYATYIGRFDVAIGETESVLRENPAYRYASIALGLARLSNGDLAGAEEAYRQLGELDETGADLAALGLADLALYRGDLREAKRILLQAFGHDVDSRPRFVAAKQLIVLSEIAVLENDSGAARDRTERALSLSEDIGTRFQATEIYLRLGARAEAATLTDAMSNENAMDSRALAGVLRAEASLLDGHPEAAIRYLNESQQIADTWLGRYALGRSYLEAQAYVEAASEFETSLRRKGEATALFLDDSPSFRYVANVHYFLARTQEALGSVPGAIDSYTTYLKIKKNSNGGALVEDAKQRLDALR